MKLHALLSERPIAFYPALRKITGSITAAILLQQLLYWWDKRLGEAVYKTVHEMEAETSLTEKEQRTAIKALKAAGFIEVVVKGVPPTRHFIVHIDAINDALMGQIKSAQMAELNQPKGQNQICQNGGNNTENTTENTTENNPPCIPPFEMGDSTHVAPSHSQTKPKKETPRQVLERVLIHEDAAAVLEHRQRLRKPLTHRAAKLLANAFSEIEPGKRSEAVDMMIVSGWTGFKAEWFNNRQQQSSCPSSRADMQPSEMLAEHIMRIESDAVGRHSREAFVRWAVACRGYALSRDWKAVLVEIDTIVKALNGRLADGRDDLLALAIEDLTAGEGGKKLNADMIVRRYNELHAMWKGRSEMIYDDAGMPAGFRTVLTDEGKALHKRLQERFGSSLLEDGRDRG